MKYRICALLTFAILAVSIALHGAVQEAWVARYNGGPTIGTNVSIALAPQGNLVVAGHGTSTNGDYDYLILKYSPNGTLLWSSRYDSAPGSNDLLRALAVDTDGSVYVAGTSKTVKYNSNGVLKWVAPYGACGLALDPHGDVCITGFSESSYATAKLDKETGSNMWLRTYSYLNRAGYGDISEQIAVDSRSNIVVGGIVYCHVGHPIYDVYVNRLVLKYDSAGSQVMVSVPFPSGCYNYPNGMHMVGLGIDSGGNVYDGVNAHQGGSSTIKYNSSGVAQWQTLYDGYAGYVVLGLSAMICDDDGFVYLTGISLDPGENILTEKISPSGNKVWRGTYLGNSRRRGNAVTVNRIGEVVAVGWVRSDVTGDDYVTIKYDRDGHEQWSKLYNGAGNGWDSATAVAATGDGTVYVSGASANANGVLEIATIKYVDYQPIAWQPGGMVRLEFAGTNAQPCRIQASSNLSVWDELATVTPDANNIAHYTDTNAPSFPHRFYRMLCP
jgi:hypothetical protein